MKYLLIGLLHLWRFFVSPLYGNVCRYYPSCSAYALDAVRHHGTIRGSWYAARRLLRCHPWAPGGYDPVPGTVDPTSAEHADEVQGETGVPDPGRPSPRGRMMDEAA